MHKILLRLTLGVTLGLPLPALAEGSGELPRWLGAVGEFIQNSIEPPRTAEELLRQEEEDRLSRRAALTPSPTPEPEPEPQLFDPPPELDPGLGPEPGLAAPDLDIDVDIEPAALPVPAPLPQIAVPAPAPNVAPPPRPQPVPATLPAFPAAEPISPAERIAGTATSDQALKLGGPADLYATPIRRPAAPRPSP